MAIIEEEFQINIKPITIFESLIQQDNSALNLENDITITYPGDKDDEFISTMKNFLIQGETDKNIDFNSFLKPQEEKVNDSNNKNDESYQNNLFSIKYKDIYIGGVSPNFQIREGFGLNKYNEEQIFYLGQWKNNMKEGIGFLKIDDDTFYIGYFHHNQFDGEGILYLKSKNILFLGQMSNGAIDEGFYLDINNDVYYIGKFINNKKNDDNCAMIEMKNQHIFVGRVENDVFENGYLCLYNSEIIQKKDENGEDLFEISFFIEKIFYFYKAQDNNNQFIYQFENDFKEVLYQNMKKIFGFGFELQKQIQYILDYIKYLNTLAEDDDFIDLNKYNEKMDSSLLYMFKNNYNYYLNNYLKLKDDFDINEIKNEINISQEIQGEENEQ